MQSAVNSGSTTRWQSGQGTGYGKRNWLLLWQFEPHGGNLVSTKNVVVSPVAAQGFGKTLQTIPSPPNAQVMIGLRPTVGHLVDDNG